MGMRITTGMMMNTYRYNLQGTTTKLSNSRDKVISGRNFDSYAEDPATATQAWRIRRAMNNNFDYQANNTETYSRFNIAWTTMGVVNNKLSDATGQFSTIRALNGGEGQGGAGRQPLGQVLDKTAETIVQAMNSAKYGDHFVFSGTDEMNVPFSWSSDMKTLYYRGIDVNAEEVKMPNGPRPSWAPQEGYDLPKPEDMPTEAQATANNEKAWYDYYTSDWAKLQAMAHEEQNVDLGMGLKEDANGKLINGSAFDRSLPGINMLGFGVDKDGDPKNMVMILKRLGELCGNCDPDSGEWENEGDGEEALRLLDKFQAAYSEETDAYVTIETRSKFLQENQLRLETQGDYLQEERANLEQADLADAITEFSWDYYCYSAALKVGTQLLSQTLLDYMS